MTIWTFLLRFIGALAGFAFIGCIVILTIATLVSIPYAIMGVRERDDDYFPSLEHDRED